MSDSKDDRASALQRALRCWQLMDKSEQACVRMGMSPHWTTLEDLGGKASPSECYEKLEGADAHRLAAVALMEIAEKQGGMIA